MFKSFNQAAKSTFKLTQNNFNQFKSQIQTNRQQHLFKLRNNNNNTNTNNLSRSIIKLGQQQQQTRKVATYPNLSQGTNTGALVTGIAGTVALLGLGYYGLKYLNGPRQVHTYTATGEPVVYTDTSTVLTQGVRDYLTKTFSYVGVGATLTAASAVLAFKSGLAHRMLSMGPLGSIGLFAGTIATMYATQAVDTNNAGLKHAMFAGFNGIMGVSLCTLGLFAPASILIRAGLYSLAIVGGLTTVALNAKEERFLMWGGALSSALLVLIIGSFGRIFLPARFVKTGYALDNLWLYGGLAIFGGLMLYDTQRVMRNARQFEEIKRLAVMQGGHRQLTQLPRPDYIAESISIYLNLINIFIRMVMIMGNRNQRRR